MDGDRVGRARAQQALRDAARRLRADAPDAPAVAVVPPQAPPPPPQGPRRRPRHSVSRLLTVDEVFVGRDHLGAPLAYREADGTILADVSILRTGEGSKLGALAAGESSRHVDERWVVAEKGEARFFVEQYRATGKQSYGVFDPDGAPLGTYVREGGVLHRDIVVREAASAPVATIRTRHHRHEIVYADGTEVGVCWRASAVLGGDDDDEVWGLQLESGTVAELLDRRALVAAPLVCHLMAFPKRHFDAGGEIGIVLVETVPPAGLVVVGVERAVDGLYWLRRRLD